MGIDPSGTSINWTKVVTGTLLVAIGVCVVAAVLSSGGTCAPLVAAAYSVIGTSGLVTTYFGVNEVAEGITGDNPLKDQLGEETYDTVLNITLAVDMVGVTLLDSGLLENFSCFVSGTMVDTEDGLVPIEKIQAGDYVWARDPETGETELKQVVQTYINETNELVHVYVNDDEIICTNEHPFYSPVKGWTAACDLRAGDILVMVNGEYVVVEKVQHELLENPVNVYNFEVQDFHTYFVGNVSVLVHNECGPMTSRGSSAVKQPSNLTEKLALEQVRSNPQGIKIPFQMNDPRWPASEGWVKMQQIVPTSQGDINIHYVYNENLKIFDDFKIK